MTENNKLGLIVGYYLSRFPEAHSDLGYASFSQAIKKIGEILDVKPRTIQNFRDEFDPYHDNKRAGWHQRAILPSRKRVMQAFQDLDQHSLKEIVEEILENKDFRNSPHCEELTLIFSDKRDSYIEKRAFSLRGATGLLAEEFFKTNFEKTGEPFAGSLIDRRQDGCGYDFEIEKDGNKVFVEVKGLASTIGGVSLTDKEWMMARKCRKSYFLALVLEVKESGRIVFIKDPSVIFTPQKNIYQAIRIDWSISSKDIQTHIGKTFPFPTPN